MKQEVNMINLKILILSVGLYVNSDCFAQVIDSDYLLVHYVHIEEFFPNHTFFIPLDSSILCEGQLIEKLNDINNRIYVDLAFFVLREPEKNADVERFVNKILANTYSLFYISKKNNIRIHRVTIAGSLENKTWDTLNSIYVPYFIMDNNRVVRSFREVKDKKVLSDMPLLR